MNKPKGISFELNIRIEKNRLKEKKYRPYSVECFTGHGNYNFEDFILKIYLGNRRILLPVVVRYSSLIIKNTSSIL